MNELIPREKGSPGRVRTVTASAWIARRHRGGNYHSHVYVGTGRVQVLSTHTVERVKALEFNRCHLLQALKINAASIRSASQDFQPDLLAVDAGGDNAGSDAPGAFETP